MLEILFAAPPPVPSSSLSKGLGRSKSPLSAVQLGDLIGNTRSTKWENSASFGIHNEEEEEEEEEEEAVVKPSGRASDGDARGWGITEISPDVLK